MHAWVIPGLPGAQVTVQRHQVYVVLQRVVRGVHGVAERLWRVIGVVGPEPIRFPVENMPAPFVLEGKIDGAREIAAELLIAQGPQHRRIRFRVRRSIRLEGAGHGGHREVAHGHGEAPLAQCGLRRHRAQRKARTGDPGTTDRVDHFANMGRGPSAVAWHHHTICAQGVLHGRLSGDGCMHEVGVLEQAVQHVADIGTGRHAAEADDVRRRATHLVGLQDIIDVAAVRVRHVARERGEAAAAPDGELTWRRREGERCAARRRLDWGRYRRRRRLQDHIGDTHRAVTSGDQRIDCRPLHRVATALDEPSERRRGGVGEGAPCHVATRLGARERHVGETQIFPELLELLLFTALCL